MSHPAAPCPSGTAHFEQLTLFMLPDDSPGTATTAAGRPASRSDAPALTGFRS
jgi:hypothetical protein